MKHTGDRLNCKTKYVYELICCVASCFIMIVIQFVTSYSLKCDSNKTEEKKKTANKQTSVLI